MQERMVLMFLVYIFLYFLDVKKHMKQARHEVFIYAIFVFVSLYLSIKYVFGLNWFNMYDFIFFLLNQTSQKIVDYLNVTP